MFGRNVGPAPASGELPAARKYPFNYQLAMGLARSARPDEWLGGKVTITEDVTEHNQRAFYEHWARLMAGAQ